MDLEFNENELNRVFEKQLRILDEYEDQLRRLSSIGNKIELPGKFLDLRLGLSSKRWEGYNEQIEKEEEMLKKMIRFIQDLLKNYQKSLKTALKKM